jgi:uncharacterized protein with HEPN domain
MRREASFLRDILSAARKIEAITAATSEESFLRDEVLPAAVLHHLTVMGEAISRLSPELRERHPEVPWHQIVAVRHRIVHAYFDLDWQILWTRQWMTSHSYADRSAESSKASFRNRSRPDGAALG